MICLLQLTATYSLAGRQEDARKTASEFLRLNPKFSAGSIAKLYKDPAATKRLIDALTQGWAEVIGKYSGDGHGLLAGQGTGGVGDDTVNAITMD